MAVRNFWIEADIDGKETILKGGPRSKTGGMRIVVNQRDNGQIKEALRIYCSEVDGKLYAEVFDKDHELVYSNKTDR